MTPVAATRAIALNRKQVLDLIAIAQLRGYFGLFVGTGFSKALTQGNAPNFEQILSAAAEELGVPFDLRQRSLLRGRSYPGLASEICNRLYRIKRREYKAALAAGGAAVSSPPTREEAVRLFKNEIANQSNLKAVQSEMERYRSLLANLKPQWVITTNYDFVLETLIDRAVSLLPGRALVPRSDRVPIYHLHGHRLLPESIVITEEDYVSVLGQVEYRQQKLATLLTESCTLMIGYSLGDINVKTAMTLAHSFGAAHRREGYEGVVVQALYRENPRKKPRIGVYGEIVLETDDVYGLLWAVERRKRKLLKRFVASADELELYLGSDPEDVFHGSGDREEIVNLIRYGGDICGASRVVEFLNRALEPEWERARENDGWPHYDHIIELVLDVLMEVPLVEMPPLIFDYMFDKLADVANFIDPEGRKVFRMAYDATLTWDRRKTELPVDTVAELKSHAKRFSRFALSSLLEGVA